MSHQVPVAGPRTGLEALYHVLSTTLGVRATSPVRVELGGKDKTGHATAKSLAVFLMPATDSFGEGEPTEANFDSPKTVRRNVRLDVYAPDLIEADLLINDVLQSLFDSFHGLWRPVSVKWGQESDAKTASGETAALLLELSVPVRRRVPVSTAVTPTQTESEYSLPAAMPPPDEEEPSSGGWTPR